MAERKICRRCEAPLFNSALEGLCGKCLAGLAFAAEADRPELSPPLVGDYEIIAEIGRGGMGVVYKARQRSLNRIVALKMILQGPFSTEASARRFQTEAEAAARLHHPNIVTIYEIGRHDGHPFLSMEFVEGRRLGDLVQEKPLTSRRAAQYLKTIADATHYAHEQGVIHRDLKPSNLLVDPLDQPRITDFGLAKLADAHADLTISGQALGSPGYMSPEHALGRSKETGVRSDVYSLGAVLYHLLTGRPPFQGETLHDVLMQAQNSEPLNPRRLNASIPPPLETICLKCLQKDPGRRYGSGRELADELGRFLAAKPILARPVGAAERLWLWCLRHPIHTVLSAALALALFGGIGGILLEWRRAGAYAEEMRTQLYAADINLAAQAVQHSDLGLARRTLAVLRPKPGERDLRGFEWRYLANLCMGQQSAMLTGHTWIVTCAAFSPDRRMLATGSQDGTVRVWDAERAKPVTTLPSEGGAIWSVGFSDDGAWLMAAGNQRQVELWDLQTQRRVSSFPGQVADVAQSGPVLATARSSPLYWEDAGKAALWNYRTGQKIWDVGRPARRVLLSPDGKWLALACPERNIEIWDTQARTLARKLETSNAVWSMAFSPNGAQFAAAGWSDSVFVWDMASNSPPRALPGHTRNFWSVSFSPDGHLMATTSSDQTVRLWDARTLNLDRSLLGHDSEVWCVAWRSDGKQLASGGKDQKVMLWDPARNPDAMDVPNASRFRATFSPDGQQVGVLDPSGPAGQCQLWDVHKRVKVRDLGGDLAIGFTAERQEPITLDDERAALQFWPARGEPRAVGLSGFRGGQAVFNGTGFSSRVFFAVDEDGILRWWDTGSGQTMGTLRGPKPPIRRAVMSPDSESLALSVEREDFVRLYHLATQAERRLKGHRDFISGLAFSPDGKLLATGSMDGTAKLWDCASGREVAALPGHLEETTDVAFSPDGKTLASVGHRQSVKLWHVPTRRELLTVDLPRAGLYLQFSPEGSRLMVATDDNTIQFLTAPNLP